MSKVDIPQATLPRIRQVVDAIAAGSKSRSEIQAAKSISRRQTDYGVQAAQALGLIEERADSTLRLLDLGKQLATAPDSSSQAKEVFRRAIQQSAVMRELVPGLLDPVPPSRALLARRIREAGVSSETADQRAGMILKWRDLLAETQSQLPLKIKASEEQIRSNTLRVEPRASRTAGEVDRVIASQETSAIRSTLSWFSVENFKSIKKLHLAFRPFMVFVGPNGAGKTNVLQALSVFLDILAEGTTEPIEVYGGFEQLVRRAKRRVRAIRFVLRAPLESAGSELQRTTGKLRSGHEPWVMEAEVVLRPAEKGTAVHVESEQIKLSENGNAPFVASFKNGALVSLTAGHGQLPYFSPQFIPQAGTTDRQVLNLMWLLRANGLRPPAALMRLRLDASALRSDSQLQGRRHGSLLGVSGDGLPLAVERLQKTPAFKRILAGLAEVYPRITGVDTIHPIPGQVSLRFQEADIERGLGQANISDGVMHALALLIALEGAGGFRALAIEEPENALHPWALRKLMARAQEIQRRAPLLLTTHSPEVINSVADPSSLFIVENHRHEGTVVTPALEKESALRSILAEEGQKLGDVWLSGVIGGIPEAAEDA